MKKIASDKKLRLSTTTIQTLTPADISGVVGGAGSENETKAVSVCIGCSASCGMGCDARV